MQVQRLKIAILPIDLPCSGPVTHSGEILTTGKICFFSVNVYWASSAPRGWMANEQIFEFQSSGKSVQLSHCDNSNKYRPACFFSLQCIGKNISKPVEERIILIIAPGWTDSVFGPPGQDLPFRPSENQGRTG